MASGAKIPGGISCRIGNTVCAFDGAIPLVPPTYLSATMLRVLCGFCLFELIDACWSAIFHCKAGLTLTQDVLRYLAFSAPAVLLGLLPLFLGWMVEANQSPASRFNFGLISFQVYILFLALYWMLRGLHSSRDWQKGGQVTRDYRQ